MAQTIWVHRLADSKRKEAAGMEYICEHLFQDVTPAGKLSDTKGWNPLPDATAKDGTAYRVLLCNVCEKNYTHGHVRLAKEAVLV